MHSLTELVEVGTTYGVWSYHWGAQRKYKTPDGDFPRISIAAFNKGYASIGLLQIFGIQ